MRERGEWSAGWRNHQPSASRRARVLRLVQERRARHSALHCGDLCPRDRIFRAPTGGSCPPRSGRLSPTFVDASSSHSRQPLVVGADGYPGPPGSVAANHARGRRTCSTSGSPLEAPLMSKRWEDKHRHIGLSSAARPPLSLPGLTRQSIRTMPQFRPVRLIMLSQGHGCPGQARA
jgi:hypothetical protein